MKTPKVICPVEMTWFPHLKALLIFYDPEKSLNGEDEYIETDERIKDE